MLEAKKKFLVIFSRLKKKLKCGKGQDKEEKKVNDSTRAIYEESVVPFMLAEADLVGYKLFDPDFTMGFRFFLCNFNSVSYTIINGIDIWLIWGSAFENICFCVVTWMFGFTGIMYAYASMNNKLLYCDLMNTIYENGDKLDKVTEAEEIEKYKKHSLICKKLYHLTSVVCFIGACITVFYPVAAYIFFGKVMLPFGFFIPGVSMTTSPGYFINYAYHVFEVIVTVIGLIMSTIHLFFLFNSNAYFQVDNIVIKLRKLNGAIEAKPNVNGHANQLAKIIELHQKFRSYLGVIDKVYSDILFVNISCYTFMNVITLYVLVLEKNWFIGYYVIVTVFGLIFIPCAVGTYMEMKNDELIDEIYCVSWYLLTPRERMPFKLLLLGAQSTSMLTCKFLPLNVNTFRKTYSNIYSFLTFLLDTN